MTAANVRSAHSIEEMALLHDLLQAERAGALRRHVSKTAGVFWSMPIDDAMRDAADRLEIGGFVLMHWHPRAKCSIELTETGRALAGRAEG